MPRPMSDWTSCSRRSGSSVQIRRPARRLAAMIDLRSDTFTRPTPAMRRAMAEAEVGDDVWGEDPTIKRLEAGLAERPGHQAPLYVPSGTMGNQICLRLAAPPGTEVLANEDNHILWYEAAAAPVLSGVQLHPVPGPRGVLDPPAARARVRAARYGVPTSALGAPVGSAVVGGRDLVARAREVRHLYGGAMRQAGVLAAAALVALDEMVDRLAEDHANARGLAATVAAAVPGSLDPAAVQTNMVVLAAGAFGTDGPGLVERLEGLGVLAADTDPDRVRLVFSYEVGADDAERAAKAVVAAAG